MKRWLGLFEFPWTPSGEHHEPRMLISRNAPPSHSDGAVVDTIEIDDSEVGTTNLSWVRGYFQEHEIAVWVLVVIRIQLDFFVAKAMLDGSRRVSGDRLVLVNIRSSYWTSNDNLVDVGEVHPRLPVSSIVELGTRPVVRYATIMTVETRAKSGHAPRSNLFPKRSEKRQIRYPMRQYHIGCKKHCPREHNVAPLAMR
jgi:hypothetical protein